MNHDTVAYAASDVAAATSHHIGSSVPTDSATAVTRSRIDVAIDSGHRYTCKCNESGRRTIRPSDDRPTMMASRMSLIGPNPFRGYHR